MVYDSRYCSGSRIEKTSKVQAVQMTERSLFWVTIFIWLHNVARLVICLATLTRYNMTSGVDLSFALAQQEPVPRPIADEPKVIQKG